MTPDEYIVRLETRVKEFDPEFVEETKDWSLSDKLYVYLHKIQLDYMSKYYMDLQKVHHQLMWIRNQTS